AFINNSQLKDVQVFTGGPNGFSKERTQIVKLADPTSIRTGDVNGDGYADLVITSSAKSEGLASLVSGQQSRGERLRYFYILPGGPNGVDEQRQIKLPSYEAS